MRLLTVTKLLEEYSKTEFDIGIPEIYNKSISFMDRIWDICSYHQHSTIVNKIGGPPSLKGLLSKKSLEVSNKYQRQFERELQLGIGRQSLINKIPEYINPNNIPNIVIAAYNDNPRHGGDVAQRLLGFNPDISVPPDWFYKAKENTRIVKIPGTDIHIKYRLDYEDFFGGLYEFKLTTKKNQKRKLSEAILQLHIYDFVLRLDFNISCWQGMLIDIALVDEKKIIFYNLFSNPYKIPIFPEGTTKYIFKDKNLYECRDYYQNIVTETLLKLFSDICADQILDIKQALDNTYKIIRSRLHEDYKESIFRHKVDE